jgi:hypothetical protein
MNTRQIKNFSSHVSGISNRTALNNYVREYILDCIYSEDYEDIKQPETDKEKLQFLADCFMSEYCFRDNIRRFGSYQNTFAEWCMGLPSSFNCDYENHKILELAVKWGSITEQATEAQQDKILNNWFNFIAAKVMQLFCKHGIQIECKE